MLLEPSALFSLNKFTPCLIHSAPNMLIVCTIQAEGIDTLERSESVQGLKSSRLTVTLLCYTLQRLFPHFPCLGSNS